MHVDATGEHGRGTLLVVMAGWRKWILGSWKVSSEQADLIKICPEEVVSNFVPPCSIMRDLGRAMTPSVDELVSSLGITIPVLACHQHFLADIGTDFLDPGHSMLCSLFRKAKLRPNLSALIRELGRIIGTEINDVREEIKNWQASAEKGHHIGNGTQGLGNIRAVSQWILDYKADATGLDFPFDRPYLDFYKRCLISTRALDAFMRQPPEDKKLIRVLNRLYKIIEPVVKNPLLKKQLIPLNTDACFLTNT
jgi:hypothetical protein